MKFIYTFEEIIGLDNLLEAWQEFLIGKRSKRDVQFFSLRLMDNIFALHKDLYNHTYKHGGYQAFNICDPKPRNIHKAMVRDRLLRHAIHRKLYPFFDRIFITDSYSCRQGKGVHKALNQLKLFGHKVGKNDTRVCWVLKCDIKKFFANIDHQILLKILSKYIDDHQTQELLHEIIESFSVAHAGVGLPLGNLTSQLFVNVYMNEFDQFIKHNLRMKYYIRYADDFLFLSEDRYFLEKQLIPIKEFLRERLRLELHPNKVYLKTLSSGVDFLGWIHFPKFRILRTTTKRRMLKRIREYPKPEVLCSYLGLLQHGDTFELQSTVYKEYLLNQ